MWEAGIAVCADQVPFHTLFDGRGDVVQADGALEQGEQRGGVGGALRRVPKHERRHVRRIGRNPDVLVGAFKVDRVKKKVLGGAFSVK